MSNTWPCEEARALMGGTVTTRGPTAIPEALRTHLAACPACQREFDELTQTAALLDGIPPEFATPGDALWESIEAKIPGIPQERIGQKQLRPEVSREILMAQYAYLVVLGISLWCCLTIGQPFFQQVLQGYGLQGGNWLIDEYGLFLLFFSLGGFVSILAAPILIQMQTDESRGKSLFRRLARFFTGNLRLFAC